MERSQLPVKNFKEQIMSTIHKNPVVIIRGATGCGKTTQVPQYILDEFVQAGRASECNIIVTQVSLLKCLLICVLGNLKNNTVMWLAAAAVYPLSQDGSVLCQCLNVYHSREEKRWGKVVATVCVLSLSCPDLMPASSSAQLVRSFLNLGLWHIAQGWVIELKMSYSQGCCWGSWKLVSVASVMWLWMKFMRGT